MLLKHENKHRELFAAWDSHNVTFPAKFHCHVEVCLVRKGSLRLTVEEREYFLEEGDLYVVFPNVLHAVDMSSTEKQLWLFSPELLPSLKEQLLSSRPKCPVIRAEKVSAVAKLLLDRCVRLYMQDKKKHRSLLLSHSESLLRELLMDLELADKSVDRGLIQRLIRYLMENSGACVTLDSVSRELGYSKFYISRIVSEMFGCNFRTIVNKYRISAAQEALRNTSKSICQISYDCGFQNQSTFNRAFLRACGMTPTEYRRKNR